MFNSYNPAYSHIIFIAKQGLFYLQLYGNVIEVILGCLKIYELMIDIRILLSWFLNINPYFPPVQTLWESTDFIMKFGRLTYKKFFFIDLTATINLSIFKMIMGILQNQINYVAIIEQFTIGNQLDNFG